MRSWIWLGLLMLCAATPAQVGLVGKIKADIDGYNSTAGSPLVKGFSVPFSDGSALPVTLPPELSWTAINQKPDAWYKEQTQGDLTITNVVLNQGGLVHSIGGNNLRVLQCYSKGAPSGAGKYFLIIATGPGRHALFDNTGVKAGWIFSGNEAAIRVMGNTEEYTEINVDACCRLHDTKDGGLAGINDPTKTVLAPLPIVTADGRLIQPIPPKGHSYTFWKQAEQFRDEKKWTKRGGRAIGQIDIGKQAAPNDPQNAGVGLLSGVGMTDLPHFTSSYGQTTMLECYKINMDGTPVLDSAGNKVMWPNRVWAAHQ